MCLCVCVCVCVHVLTFVCVSLRLLCLWHLACTHFLCVSLRLLCVCHLPFSPRYEAYICPRLAIFLAGICTHNVSLYHYICAALFLADIRTRNRYSYSQRVLVPLHMRRETSLLSACFTYNMYLASSYCCISSFLTLLYTLLYI